MAVADHISVFVCSVSLLQTTLWSKLFHFLVFTAKFVELLMLISAWILNFYFYPQFSLYLHTITKEEWHESCVFAFD